MKWLKRLFEGIEGDDGLVEDYELFWFVTVFAIIGWVLYIVMGIGIYIAILANVFQLILIKWGKFKKK